MDRELLKSKTLSDLREIAKLAGVKSVTTYRKKELLEILFQLEEQNHQAEQEEMSPMPEHSDSQKAADEDYLPMDIFEKEEEEEEQAPAEDFLAEEQRENIRYGDEEADPPKKKRVVEYVQGNDAVNELLATGDCKGCPGHFGSAPGWIRLFAQR